MMQKPTLHKGTLVSLFVSRQCSVAYAAYTNPADFFLSFDLLIPGWSHEATLQVILMALLL
jgi:hypothetical protein